MLDSRFFSKQDFLLSSLSPQDQEALMTAAKQTAREMGHEVYYLKTNHKKKLKYFITGCQGEGEEAQQEVAELMYKMAQNPDLRPDFILFLGDNFYPKGVSSPLDPAFEKQFYNMYKGFFEMGIPIFLCLGNHDVYRCEIARFSWEGYKDDYVSINQIAHHYIPQHESVSVDDIKRQFSPHKPGQPVILNTHELQLFNMPNGFFSLVLDPDEGRQIIVLNSNSILRDFITYFKNGCKSTNEKMNQIEWLLSIYQDAVLAKRDVAIAMHHPRRTIGKRIIPEEFDTDHYLTQEEVAYLQKIFGTNTESYNDLLSQLFDYLKIKASRYYVAHDHFMCIDDDDDFQQFTFGSGGGGLHAQESLLRYPNTKYHWQKYGFGLCDGEIMRIFSVADKGLHHELIYDCKSHDIIREVVNEQTVSAQMRKMIHAACNEFFVTYKAQELAAHKEERKYFQSSTFFSGTLYNVKRTYERLKSKLLQYIYQDRNRAKDIVIANSLKAYVDQPYLPNLDDLNNTLKNVIEIAPNKDNPLSFYKILEKHFMEDMILKDIFYGLCPPLYQTPSKAM